MRRAIYQAMDRIVIRAAAKAVHRSGKPGGNAERLHADLGECRAVREAAPVPKLNFTSKRRFEFPSAIQTPHPANNTVRGHLYEAKGSRKLVLLLHGLGGEIAYYSLFPWIAMYLNSKGISVAMIELPYHASRRPKGPGARHSFITDDLDGMLEATWQGVSDIRSIVAWARANGFGPIGLWGFSLGSWLGGLSSCGPTEQAPDAMVLAIPVSEMKEAVETLAFCAPVKEALAITEAPLERLDLRQHTTQTSTENILLVQSIWDLFAPTASVERLRDAWRGAQLLPIKHSHISIFFSPFAILRAADWLAGKLTVESRSAVSRG